MGPNLILTSLNLCLEANIIFSPLIEIIEIIICWNKINFQKMSEVGSAFLHPATQEFFWLKLMFI